MEETNAEEISLKDLFLTLWWRKRLIVCVALAGGVVATATAFLLPVKYQSSAVLALAGDGSSGSSLGAAGALLSQFGGLASLGGIGLGGSSGKKAEAIATLNSAALTEGFIRDKDLLPVLFAKDWDASQKQWKNPDQAKHPTVWIAEKMFDEKVRTVTEDKKTGLITLSIIWKDPVQAADWVTELVNRTNNRLRQQSIEQSQRNLDYLHDQLKQTSVVELQQAIYGLIEAEIKQVMIAKGSEQFAFRVIDPARVSEKKVSPKRALMILLGGFAGLIMGILLALLLPSESKLPQRVS